MFAAVLHMPLTAEQYEALTVVELEEFRQTVHDLTRKR